MREPTTYIKLDRNIMNWRWLSDPNTLAVWIYLLVNANNEASDLRNFTVERGEVCVSLPVIAEKMGLSVRNVRTALDHLVTTGEITKKRHNRKQMTYKIEGFERYQAKVTYNRHTSDIQVTDNRHTTDIQPTRSKEEKEEKKERNKEFKKGERAGARVSPQSGGGLDWDKIRAMLAEEEANDDNK